MNIAMRKALAGLIGIALATGVVSHAQLADKKALTLNIAKQVATAAEEAAGKNQWHMFIAIVDDGSNLMYLERMDDAQLASLDVSFAQGTECASVQTTDESLRGCCAQRVYASS
jgi:uncharacterized protein GlcG (DUF336 family)